MTTERELQAQDRKLTELIEDLMFACWASEKTDDELDRDPDVQATRAALEQYVADIRHNPFSLPTGKATRK